jgi:hypothetical protein
MDVLLRRDWSKSTSESSAVGTITYGEHSSPVTISGGMERA